ncbi:beta-1,3-galactosyltransferase 5-like [Oratosquilla oratoria]|uniref:beta-1,3-galactosyltransferase 5-like n=1 Tax=Oratosquilla oratoria TaxID=337810 RepID=UPI003F7712ED
MSKMSNVIYFKIGYVCTLVLYIGVVIKLLKDISQERETQLMKRYAFLLHKCEPHPLGRDLAYRYLIDEPEFCNGVPLEVVNVIPVTPEDLKTRQHVREQWGRPEIVRLTGLRPLFLLGLSSTLETQASVQEESRLHRDLIQVDFVDSYFNLSLKTLSALHWKHTRCHGVPWLLKSDADAFVNPFRLVEILRNATTAFVCYALWGKVPCRPGICNESKWLVTEEQYPEEVYPGYCNGPAYAIHNCVVPALFSIADQENPFHIEDIYFTGILRQEIGYRVRHHPRLFKYYNFKKTLLDPFEIDRHVAVVGAEVNQNVSHEAMWKNLFQLYEVKLNLRSKLDIVIPSKKKPRKARWKKT